MGIIAVIILGIVVVGFQPVAAPEPEITTQEVAEILDIDESLVLKKTPAKTVFESTASVVVNTVADAVDTVVTTVADTTASVVVNTVTNTVETVVATVANTTRPTPPPPAIKIEDIVIENTTMIFTESQVPEPITEPLSLFREFTFRDGTQDSTTIEAAQFQIVSLDFIAFPGDNRPLTNGTVSFELSVPIAKEISDVGGTYSILLNNEIIRSLSFDGDNSDVIDGSVLLFAETFEINQLVVDLSPGTHTLKIRVDSTFVVYSDGTREFTSPNEIIYSVDFEKNDAKTIKRNEQGDLIKTFDFDVPITISSNAQEVRVVNCQYGFRLGSCQGNHYYDALIPGPALGRLTITDQSNNEVVASHEAQEQIDCTYSFLSRPHNANITRCGPDDPRTSIGIVFSAQRGESYRIDVSDPSASWVINVPETGGDSYEYSCIDKRELVEYGNSRPRTYNITSERVCNFP